MIPRPAPVVALVLTLALAACGDDQAASTIDGGTDLDSPDLTDEADLSDVVDVPIGQPRWVKPGDHASIVLCVDDRANRTYAGGDMRWSGTFTYDGATNTIEVDDAAWPPGQGPYPPLYDDGPYAEGGHEAEGATAGDGVFEVEVFYRAEADTTFEYGLVNEDDRWIWSGPTGTVEVDAGETGTVVADGLTFEAFGSIDLRVTLDTSALHADFSSIDPSTDAVYVTGTMVSWAPIELRDSGLFGDAASSDGIVTFTLSEHLGPHDGLLSLGQEAQFVFVFFAPDGTEYRLGSNSLTNGVAASSTWSGAWEPEELLLRTESGSGDNNTAVMIGQDESQADDPILRFIDPDRGPTSGGTPVELRGEDFQAGATVTFGTSEASCVIQSDRIITCSTPPRTSDGVVPVTVENPDGGSNTQLGFTYLDVASAPRIDTITPPDGSELGGTVVTIGGANYAGGARVSFGDALGIDVQLDGSDTITATTPGGVPGPVDVTVRNPDGQTATRSAGFSYRREGIDWAAIQWPTHTVIVGVDEPLPPLYGVVYEPGVTDALGQGGGISAEIIVGPAGTDPSADFTGWTAHSTSYNGDLGNDDEYTQSGDVTLSEEGELDWAFRFSLDGGSTWYYADLDTDNATYDPAASGSLVVTSGMRVDGVSPAAISIVGSAELLVEGSNFSDATEAFARPFGGGGDFGALALAFDGPTQLTLDLPGGAEPRPTGGYDLRFDDGGDSLLVENAYLVGYVWSPTLDGALGDSFPNWDPAFIHAESDLATTWTGHELRALYASFDQDGLYIGVSADIQRQGNAGDPGNVIVVYVDTDFGAGSGFSDMAAIGDEDDTGEQAVPETWWRLDRALTSQIDAGDVPGFGADVAFGTFDLVPIDGDDYLDAFTGWRGLRAGDNVWHLLDATCEGGPCVAGAPVDAETGGAIETFVPWSVLYGEAGVPIGGRRIAMFARIINGTGDFISNQSLPPEPVDPDDDDPWNVTDVVVLDVR